MFLASLSDIAENSAVLAFIAAPTLIGLSLGAYVTIRVFRRLLRSCHALVWLCILVLCLVWLGGAGWYATWLHRYMVRAGTNMPAVGADIFGLLRGMFILGPLGGLFLAPSIVAFIMTIRSWPQDFSRPRWVTFLLEKFRGPRRFYWWGLAVVLAGVLARLAVMVAVSLSDR